MNSDLVKRLHDRLGGMINQIGQPDYSLRELINGLREVRDDLLKAALEASGPTLGEVQIAEHISRYEKEWHDGYKLVSAILRWRDLGRKP